MAGKSTISITFKLDGDGKGFKNLAKDADGLKTAMTAAVSEAQKLNGRAINFAAIATGIDSAQQSIQQLHSTLKGLSDAYAVQEVAERQLETVMRQRMGASGDEIQAIKDLASAQQELGVIGDEVQLSGAQQVATFLNEKESLKALLPAMNNLLAQQKGLNATNQDAISIGNLMGKAMQGQTSALRRVGITFTDAQEQAMKYGTEQERAAMLAQIITDNVGDMNAELAKTDSGKQKQLENTLGDIKEQLGAIANGAMPFVTIAADATIALSGIVKLSMGVRAATGAITAFNLKAKAASAMCLLVGTSSNKSAALIRVFSAAMTTGAYSATAFKIALRGLMIATGVGTAIAAVTALIELMVNSTDNATDSVDVLAESTDAYKTAAASAKVNIDKEITSLGSLIRSNQDTKEAVNRLNKEYGAIFGQYKTAAEWYDVLTSRSKVYVKQIGYEAQQRALAAKIAEKQIAIEMNAEKQKDLQKQGKATQKAFRTYTYLDAAGNKNIGIHRVDVDSDEMEAAKNEAKDLNGELAKLNKELGIVDKKIQATAAEMRRSTEASNSTVSVSAMNWQQVSDAIGEAEKKLKGTTDANEIKRLKTYNAQLKARKDLLDKQLGFAEKKPKTPKTSKGSEASTGDVLPEKLDNIKAYGDAIAYWRKQQETASSEEYQNIQKTIDALEEKRDAFMGVEKKEKEEKQAYQVQAIEKLNTIQDLDDAISYYGDLQKKQSADEVQSTQQTIDALEAKKAALQRGISLPSMQKEIDQINSLTGHDHRIKIEGIGFDELTNKISDLQDMLDDLNNPVTDNQRKDIESMIAIYEQWRAEAVNTFDTYRKGWDGIKGIGGGINDITEALESDGNAWQKVCGIIDGFLVIYDGISAVVGIINLLSTATSAHTAAKTAEAVAVGASTTAAGADAIAQATATAATAPVIAANKLATASYVELAAAEYMAAHAYIPFAGFGIASGFADAAVATVQAIGIMPFANGGIISGPTLGLMGEYPGAVNNPEVVAPLDKLRDMIKNTDGGFGGEVVFTIKGRELVGILSKENNIQKRS